MKEAELVTWGKWQTIGSKLEEVNDLVYSKTSNNGPSSEKRTTSVQRTVHLPPIDFAI